MSRKKLFVNSIIYTFLGLITPAINFLLIPVYTTYLSPYQYGLITISVIFQSFLVNLFGAGVSGSYYRFYFEDNVEQVKYREELFDTCLVIIGISTLILLPLMYFGGNWLIGLLGSSQEFRMESFGWWTLLTALMIVIQTLFLSKYRNEENARKYATVSILTFTFTTLCILTGVVILHQEARGSIVGRAVGSCIPVLVMIVLLYRRRKFVFKRNLIKPLLLYGNPIMLYTLITMLYTNIDRIMVAKYFDTSVLGVFGFAVAIGAIVEILINSLNNAFKPRIYSLMGNSSDNSLGEIQLYFSIIFFSLLFVLATGILCSLIFILFFVSERYHDAFFWIPLIFACYVPRIYYIVYAVPIFYFKKTRIMPVISFSVLIVALLLNLILIPLIGIYAVIFINLLAGAMQCLWAMFYARRKKLYQSLYFSFRKVHYLYLGFLVLVIVPYWWKPSLSTNAFLLYFAVLWFGCIVAITWANQKRFAKYLSLLRTLKIGGR